jgi:UDP-N-acetylmuramyl pentapeptide phosphotransferase/UDP-N-acetylglucosamine-1-phosphate transferase
MLKVDHALYLVSLILGGIGAWVINRWGYVFGLVDKPTDRSSHGSPTPKGGGIGILAAFILASMFVTMQVFRLKTEG